MKHTTPTPPPGLRMVDRVCAACGAPFQRPAVLLALLGGRYCDGACEVKHCAPEDRSPLTRALDGVLDTFTAAAKAAGNVQQRYYADMVRHHTAESWRQHQARQADAAPVRPLPVRTNAEDALMDAIKYGTGMYMETTPDRLPGFGLIEELFKPRKTAGPFGFTSAFATRTFKRPPTWKPE